MTCTFIKKSSCSSHSEISEGQFWNTDFISYGVLMRNYVIVVDLESKESVHDK